MNTLTVYHFDLTHLTVFLIGCPSFIQDKNKLTGPLPPRVGNLDALQFLSFCKINDIIVIF